MVASAYGPLPSRVFTLTHSTGWPASSVIISLDPATRSGGAHEDIGRVVCA